MSSKKPFLIHPSNKYILTAYKATSTVLGNWDVLTLLGVRVGNKQPKLKYSIVGSDKYYGEKQM